MKQKKPPLIAFEGIDGSGKSTQLSLLARWLEDEGIPFLLTREPTDGPAGLLLRQLLRGEFKTDERVAGPLFVADRLDHLLNPEYGLLAALAAGTAVLTDRYYFSTFAYQSYHTPLPELVAANAPCARLRRPDLTVFLDLAPEKAMERIRAGRGRTELFETLDRLRAVRKAYFDAFALLKNEEKVLVLDADLPPEALSEFLWMHLRPYFMFHKK